VLLAHSLNVTCNQSQRIRHANSGLDVQVQLRQLLLAALILHRRVKRLFTIEGVVPVEVLGASVTG
jgi:hypothetical protein